jgi:hypothetical protein
MVDGVDQDLLLLKEWHTEDNLGIAEWGNEHWDGFGRFSILGQDLDRASYLILEGHGIGAERLPSLEAAKGWCR